MSTPLVENVSDTARWVAAYRARESARPDALFHDRFAERLAGERGRAIAQKAEARRAGNGWPIVVRTKLIDDLVLAAVREGCDRVVNLAAGLDARPYRLPLPPSLSWIEVDLPAMVDEKERFFEGERAACHVSRERADLADTGARAAVLDRVTAGAERVLVITEGLLNYLDAPVVRALSSDLRARPSVRWWMFDLFSPAALQMTKRGMRNELDRAPWVFAPEEGVGFFEALGWRTREVLSMLERGRRLRRLPPLLHVLSYLPQPNPRRLGRAPWLGVVRLER